ASHVRQGERTCTQGIALSQWVAESAITVERLVDRGERFVVLGREEALEPAAEQQARTPLGWESVGEAKRPRVLLRGLPVRGDLGRPRGCGRRETEHGLAVAGSLGMVRDERRVGARRLDQRREGRPMERPPPIGWQRLLDRQARKLVPERE